MLDIQLITEIISEHSADTLRTVLENDALSTEAREHVELALLYFELRGN